MDSHEWNLEDNTTITCEEQGKPDGIPSLNELEFDASEDCFTEVPELACLKSPLEIEKGLIFSKQGI